MAEEHPPTTTPAAPVPASPPAPPLVDAGEVDRLLASEDPEFAASVKDLSEAKPAEAEPAADPDVDEIVVQEKTDSSARGVHLLKVVLFHRPLKWFNDRRDLLIVTVKEWRRDGVVRIKAGIPVMLKALKNGVIGALKKVSSVVSAFFALSGGAKLQVFLIVALAAGSVFMLKLATRGPFLPHFESKFIYSFANVASQSYAIKDGEPWNDFDDPLLHPEHVVSIERIVTNLLQENGANPMALIDLYIEVGTQEGAVEVKDREVEVRDLIGRTLEQMPYDELVTVPGKRRFKTILRQRLNELLTRGRVRNVYFKSIVLKP